MSEILDTPMEENERKLVKGPLTSEDISMQKELGYYPTSAVLGDYILFRKSIEFEVEMTLIGKSDKRKEE